MLEAATLDALARLLTGDLPEALGVGKATLLLWNRRLDAFEALTPDETRTFALRPGGVEARAPETGFLLADGELLPTPGGQGEGVLVPLMARSGLVGMLVLGARRGRRRLPFRATEVRLISVLATRAAIALENHLYQRELVASERMAALGTMAGMLVHDFRNPMTVIRGWAELLATQDVPPDRVKGYASAILGMVDRLDRMTTETLDFARAGGAVAPRPVVLAPALEELLGELERELPGLTVVRHWELPPTATGQLDLDKLRRAVGTIAANARDAMKGKGAFHVFARVIPDGAAEGGAAAGRRLLLDLADEGPGVPAEIRHRVFEPFVTAGKKGGTGLGLAVARRFVEDHAGTLELLGEPPPEGPRGAWFRVVLPLDAMPAGSAGARV